MVNTRLQHYVERNSFLPDTQFGFRRAKSCQHALSLRISQIHIASSKNQHLSCVFIDIKSAFDHVCLEVLNNLLIKMKIPTKTRHFIFQLMTNRKLHFKINNSLEDPFIKNNGVLQGCVLSPLLYNLYVSDLFKILPPEIKLIQYADDTVIYCPSKDIESAIVKLEYILSLINMFLLDIKLNISPEKTKFVIFSNSPFSSIDHYSLTINGSTISTSPSVKYLGLILDYRLQWIEHANYIFAKTSKLLNIIRVLRGTWWGGHPHTLLLIYTALIRSSMEYSLYLTHFPPKLCDKIQKIQNQALRLAAGYRASTPVNVMHAETNIPFFELRLQYLADNFILKLLSESSSEILDNLSYLNSSPHYKDSSHLQHKFYPLKSYVNLSTTVKDKLQSHLKPFPFTYKFSEIIQTADVDIEPGREMKKSQNPSAEFERLTSNVDLGLSIYTDASKSPNSQHTGLAIYLPDTNETIKYKTLPQASIFSAEALAILLAIHLALNKTCKKCTIFSDSLSVLQALRNFNPIKPKNTSHFIMDMKALLHKCKAKNIHVSFIWIPAHCNITHNEAVDSSAKDATVNGTNLITFLPHSDFQELLKNNLFDKQHKTISSQSLYKGTYYFSNFYKKKSKPWYHKTTFPREHISTVNRIRSNHYNLAASLHRKDINNSPACNCGYTSQDIHHIVWNCPLYTQRNPFLNKLTRLHRKLKTPIIKSVEYLLKEPDKAQARLLTEFLKKCHLFV